VNPDLTSIVQALNRLSSAQQKGPWDYAYILLVGLTLIVLIIYTVETYRLRRAAQQQTMETGRLLEAAQTQNAVTAGLHEAAQSQNDVTAKLLAEAQRQNEIAVMPMFAVYIDRTGSAQRLLVRNVGLGPAFNVTIDTSQIEGKELVVLVGNNFMTPGEVQDLRLNVREDNSGQGLGINELYHWINTERIPDPLKLIVHCVSLHLMRYDFVFKCTPDAGHLKITFDRLGAAT
jgi:hypothetical protein